MAREVVQLQDSPIEVRINEAFAQMELVFLTSELESATVVLDLDMVQKLPAYSMLPGAGVANNLAVKCERCALVLAALSVAAMIVAVVSLVQ